MQSDILYSLLQNTHNSPDFKFLKSDCTKVLVSVNMVDCIGMIYNTGCEKILKAGIIAPLLEVFFSFYLVILGGTLGGKHSMGGIFSG